MAIHQSAAKACHRRRCRPITLFFHHRERERRERTPPASLNLAVACRCCSLHYRRDPSLTLRPCIECRRSTIIASHCTIQHIALSKLLGKRRESGSSRNSGSSPVTLLFTKSEWKVDESGPSLYGNHFNSIQKFTFLFSFVHILQTGNGTIETLN